jgi:hypothetical protein
VLGWPDAYATLVMDRVEGIRAVTSHKTDVCGFYRSINITDAFWWCD